MSLGKWIESKAASLLSFVSSRIPMSRCPHNLAAHTDASEHTSCLSAKTFEPKIAKKVHQ